MPKAPPTASRAARGSAVAASREVALAAMQHDRVMLHEVAHHDGALLNRGERSPAVVLGEPRGAPHCRGAVAAPRADPAVGVPEKLPPDPSSTRHGPRSTALRQVAARQGKLGQRMLAFGL